MKTITRSTASLFPTSTIRKVPLAIVSLLSVNGRFGRIRSLLSLGLFAIGLGASAVTPALALGQQGLHVVPSPFINNSALFGTAAIADSDIWAVGDIASGNTAQTLAEHFNGTSWNVVPTPAVQGGEFTAVDGVASNDVWAVGQQAAGSSYTTLIEHWNGTSWSVVSSPRLGHGAFLSAITAVTSNDVWAAGSVNNLGILIEHWDGTSWSFVPSVDPFAANHGSSRFNGIAAVSANNIWAVGEGAGGSFTEQWNGTSWRLLTTPSGVGLLAVTALSDGTVVAVGAACSTSCSAVILRN